MTDGRPEWAPDVRSGYRPPRAAPPKPAPPEPPDPMAQAVAHLAAIRRHTEAISKVYEMLNSCGVVVLVSVVVLLGLLVLALMGERL